MGKSNDLDHDQIMESLLAYHAAGDNQTAAAKSLGIPRTTLQSHLLAAKQRGFIREHKGKLTALETQPWTKPRKGTVKRYLLTSAQDHTKVNPEMWKNLMAMARHYDAEVLVSGFYYNKDATGQASRAKGRQRDAELEQSGADFAPEVRDYLIGERRDLAPKLTFCAELNIIPTARRPLSGMENYTYRKSTIVPHSTIALKSVGGMKTEGVKLMYTTGACTMRNYIKRKEGFRAEHFHAYSALLVEVNHDGQWWCRHVEQGSDGTMYDLTNCFRGGRLVSERARAANICWGDVHASKGDPETYDAQWGEGGGSMLDVLRPYSAHAHDLLDCGPFGHHTRKDPFEVYRAYHTNDRASIGTELRTTAQVAGTMQRPWCRLVVVNSNHDRHLEIALKTIDWRDDPENAETLLHLLSKQLKAIRTQDASFYLVEEALREFSPVALPHVEFLREDQSDVILRNVEGGIECGVHGDRGMNGARGTPGGIARGTRKTNMADKHSIEIIDNNYVAGVSGRLNMGYNKGMSSWTHGNILTYPNACRTIVSVYAGQWRA